MVIYLSFINSVTEFLLANMVVFFIIGQLWLTHTHRHTHTWPRRQGLWPFAQLFFGTMKTDVQLFHYLSEDTRMIRARGSQMEAPSLKKSNFLLESFNYADLNGASALNRDSFISSRDYGKVFSFPLEF